MPANRTERALDVFDALHETSPADRAERLNELCQGDSHLRKEVESLLAHACQTDAILESPVMPSWISTAAESDAAAAEPAFPFQFGRYRVLSRLGEGGMGVVYRAEQHEPRRHVALKVMRRMAGSRTLSERFRREAGTLAQLKHPCIAQVFDAGSVKTPSGPQPYFAMQLVEGPTLREWAHQPRPDREARLRLFMQICEAVQHAHQSGVIHRDLKPENILVEETPAGPRPRVLDFGVARLLPEWGDAHTLATEPGQIVGSLPYISPEQIEGTVDTRVDVYALGVLLFEMLTGQLPIRINGLGVLQVIDAIQYQTPAKLSAYNSAYRGDLEVIVAKALAKDMSQRYPSAASLGDDIQRFLAHLPILARKPGKYYLARKFARRHRLAVVLSAVAGLAVMAGSTGSILGLWSANAAAARQKRVLDSAVAAVRQISSDVLPELNKISGTSLARDRLLQPLLAHQAVLGEFAGDDANLLAARVDAIEAIADLELGQGRFEDALRHRMEALAMRDQLVAAHPADERQHRKLAINHVVVGDIWKERAELGQAETWYRKALDHQLGMAGSGRRTEDLLDDLAWSYCRLADLAISRNDLRQAQTLMVEAQRLLSELRAQNPARPGLTDLEQQEDAILAWVDRMSGDLEAEQRRVDRRLAMLRQMVAANPHDRVARYRFCVALLTHAGGHREDQGGVPVDLNKMACMLDECAVFMNEMVVREPSAIETKEIQVRYGELKAFELFHRGEGEAALSAIMDALTLAKAILESDAPPFIHYGTFARIVGELHDMQQEFPSPDAAQFESEAIEYFQSRCADASAPPAARRYLAHSPSSDESD